MKKASYTFHEGKIFFVTDVPYADPLNGLGHHHDHHRGRKVPKSHFISGGSFETGIEYVKRQEVDNRHK